MKKSDVATLVLIIAVVGVSVYLLVQFIVGEQSMKPVTVEVAKPITTDISSPSSGIFNENAINPTVPITIEGGDQKPIGE